LPAYSACLPASYWPAVWKAPPAHPESKALNERATKYINFITTSFSKSEVVSPHSSFLPHHFNRSRKNSDYLVEQLDSLLDHFLIDGLHRFRCALMLTTSVRSVLPGVSLHRRATAKFSGPCPPFPSLLRAPCPALPSSPRQTASNCPASCLPPAPS